MCDMLQPIPVHVDGFQLENTSPTTARSDHHNTSTKKVVFINPKQ